MPQQKLSNFMRYSIYSIVKYANRSLYSYRKFVWFQLQADTESVQRISQILINTAQKMKFSFKDWPKSAGNCEFGHIYWKIP